MDQILSKCLQGQSWAWEAFVDRYAPVLFAAVQRVLRTHGTSSQTQTAEDMTQNVFLRLIDNDFRLLKTYDSSRASMATWLTIVARSTTIDLLRRKRLAAVPLDRVPMLAWPQSPAQPVSATENLPADLLTARQKLVLHLLFDRQMSPAAVGKVLGISQQTVRSTKHKAIKKLRQHVALEDSR